MTIGTNVKFDIWLANLNPQRGSEVGKVRPVLIIKTSLLAGLTNSTIICPFTTTPSNSEITRVKMTPSVKSGIEKDSWVIIDQIRSIDSKRLIRKIGELPLDLQNKVDRSLKIMLDLE